MMRTCLLFVILSISPAFGFSGSTIVPIIVQVTDSKGNGVAGAKVEITPTPVERIGNMEIDKNSEFSQMLRAASKPVTTDALGMVLAYSSSGFLPIPGGGILCTPSGTIRVEAKGYQPAAQPFRREIDTQKSGAIELTLRVMVKLASDPTQAPDTSEKVAVPDEKAAITLAVTKWESLYGKESIASQKPFKATLKEGVWHVTGSASAIPGKGGVAEANIRQRDGEILKVTHGK